MLGVAVGAALPVQSPYSAIQLAKVQLLRPTWRGIMRDESHVHKYIGSFQDGVHTLYDMDACRSITMIKQKIFILFITDFLNFQVETVTSSGG